MTTEKTDRKKDLPAEAKNSTGADSSLRKPERPAPNDTDQARPLLATAGSKMHCDLLATLLAILSGQRTTPEAKRYQPLNSAKGTLVGIITDMIVQELFHFWKELSSDPFPIGRNRTDFIVESASHVARQQFAAIVKEILFARIKAMMPEANKYSSLNVTYGWKLIGTDDVATELCIEAFEKRADDNPLLGLMRLAERDRSLSRMMADLDDGLGLDSRGL